MNIQLIDIQFNIFKYRNGNLSQDVLIDKILSLETLLPDKLSIIKDNLKVISGNFEEAELFSANEKEKIILNEEIIIKFEKQIQSFFDNSIPFEVDSISVCKPMYRLLLSLINKHKGLLISSKVSDPHFKELNFNVKITRLEIKKIVNIDDIIYDGENLFNCKCHWSTLTVHQQLPQD